MKEILWDRRRVCSEEGSAYGAEYYLLVEEIYDGGTLFCENYGVKIRVSGGEEPEEATAPGVTSSETGVMALLNILSRNFVTPSALREILEDWLA
ncbi:MAG: DUF6514 family protein [Oscillospiraceae bacterium]|nr:DUF6514 family protein [Oscillospiraceae bacterium]